MGKTYLFMAMAMICFFVSKAQQPEIKPGNPEFPKADEYNGSNLTYKIIPGAEKSFGYDILSNGKLLIHQPVRPGLPGNKGFATKKDAAGVAELVIEKIRNGEMPPTVSEEEMKKLKVFRD